MACLHKIQPTGGVILLHDTRPSEPKSLLELKARKKTPPAATTTVGTQAATDSALSDLGFGTAAGAAAAAGVLTAVDEDDDDEEAPVPNDFELDEEDADAED